MAAQNTHTPTTPRGRRSGGTRSRKDILQAATALFAEHGFEGTSVRAIAAQAQVDPALIRHFFGSKEALFTALLDNISNCPLSPPSGQKTESQGAAVVRAYLQMWESEDTGPLLAGLVRSALATSEGNPAIKETLARHLTQSCTSPLLTNLDQASAELLSTHLLGVAVGRYLLPLPHLAALSPDELVERTAPAIQSYLERTQQPRKTQPAPKKQSTQEQLPLFDGLF
ncbi:MAG: TetR/AcrR family transcriptional regulator [Rothia sp. (in: high G+C Gram-positive bacteria)]|nr:TetR/AcrR family transcriptional regulator [Rothia sp. (in: high G+C Gram-positive bacteria)]